MIKINYFSLLIYCNISAHSLELVCSAQTLVQLYTLQTRMAGAVLKSALKLLQDCPQVNLLVGLYAGKHKENTWTDSFHFSSISKLDQELEFSLTQTSPLKDFPNNSHSKTHFIKKQDRVGPVNNRPFMDQPLCPKE